MNDPAGSQTSLIERRGKNVLPCDDPQHLALGPGGDPCREQGSGRGVQGIIPASGHLVERTEGQAATRQSRIDLLHAKWQDSALTVLVSLDAGDGRLERFQGRLFLGLAPLRGHFDPSDSGGR